MRSVRRTVVALVAAIAMSGMTTGQAGASASQGYISVSGTSVLSDDWADEGELARDTFPNSNATGLWQRVLYADGFLSLSDIDCRFGPTTERATRNWQAWRGLRDDGRAGPRTFGRADDQLRTTPSSGVVRYGGRIRDEYISIVNGRYEFAVGVVAAYRTRSAAICDA